MSDQRAYEQHFENELEAARIQLERPEHRTLVVGVTVEWDEDEWEVKVCLARSVSSGTKRHHAEGFIKGLEREVDRLKRLIGMKDDAA